VKTIVAFLPSIVGAVGQNKPASWPFVSQLSTETVHFFDSRPVPKVAGHAELNTQCTTAFATLDLDAVLTNPLIQSLDRFNEGQVVLGKLLE